MNRATSLRPESQRLPERPPESRGTHASTGPLWSSLALTADPLTTPTAEGTAREVAAAGPPVLWGLDMSASPRRSYVSVAVPGHSLAEVATYLYGSATAEGSLAAANDGTLPARLPPGRTLLLSEESLTATALAAFNTAVSQGSVLRSQGVPSEADASPTIYSFSGGGRSYQVTEGQFIGLMQGAATWIRIRATALLGDAESGRWVHHDNRVGTNAAVRGISDWVGVTSLPPESIWDPPEGGARRIVEAISGAPITLDSQRMLDEQLNALQDAARTLDVAQARWRSYINATIEGAESTQHGLEITRNVSFGVAAGLAGAVAAPAVFAAAGGGLLGGTAAVAGGTFQGVVGAGRRDFPMTTADYTEPGTGTRFVRGHNIDFADTAEPPGTPANRLSTMDPLNFTPEEADWGTAIRRLLVAQIRAASGAQGQYRQMEFYDSTSAPRFTTNGRRIPDGVYFAEYDGAGRTVRGFLVRYAQSAGFRTLADAAQYRIPNSQLPPVLHTTPLITVPVGGAGGADTRRR